MGQQLSLMGPQLVMQCKRGISRSKLQRELYDQRAPPSGASRTKTTCTQGSCKGSWIAAPGEAQPSQWPQLRRGCGAGHGPPLAAHRRAASQEGQRSRLQAVNWKLRGACCTAHRHTAASRRAAARALLLRHCGGT